MPLYVLTYIWDGHELHEEEMREGTDETAQYSCHVVGLNFDATKRVCVVADPNGGLVRGGNMEFVAVPLRPRAQPSTALSQHDVDEAAEAAKKKTKRKGGMASASAE